MDGRTLFDILPPAAPPLEAALAAGRTAAEACEAKAAAGGFDPAAAGAWVVAFLARNGPTLGEDVVTACAAVHPAHDLRAFGRVFARLARAGSIRPAGFARRKRGHGSPGVVWALADQG